MVNLYVYNDEETTILSDDAVKKLYTIDDEIVFINDLNDLKKYKEEKEKKEIDECFGWYALSNNLGICLCTDAEHKEEDIKELADNYKYIIINEKQADINSILKNKYRCVHSYMNGKAEIDVELVNSAGELAFVFEKDYDDYHTIQIWRDAHNKYYKAVICTSCDYLTDIVAVMDEEEAEEDIYVMSQWTEQDDCYATYAPYDEDEIEFIL